MKINIPFFVAYLALAGCAAIQDIAATNKDIASGEVVATIKHVQLNSTEQAIITHALNSYMEFTWKWTDIRVTPDKEKFITDFEKLKDQYLAVEEIVEKHWDGYSKEQQEKLKNYRESARDLNRSVDMLIFTNKLYFAMQEAADMSKVLIGLAAASL